MAWAVPADFVEKGAVDRRGMGMPRRLMAGLNPGSAGQLGELAEVLGGGGQEEFVPGRALVDRAHDLAAGFLRVQRLQAAHVAVGLARPLPG